MSTPALNPLVEKVRAKYPGAYDDMDDATLTKKLLAKYPQYSDLAAPPTSSMPGAPSQQPMAEPGAADRFATAAGAATANMIPARESLSHMMNDKPAAGEGDGSILPESINNAVKGTLRSTFSEPYDRARSGDIAGALGQFVPNALALGATARSMAKGLARTPAPEPVYPGGTLPETPPAEVLQAKSLSGKPQTVVDPAAGLEQPVRKAPQAAPAQQPAAPVKPAQVQAQIEKALGNEPMNLKKDVPLKDQRPAPQPDADGHTPVESSAVKSYKYDPDKQELHVKPVGGRTTYVYGDVSADQAAEFNAHNSKGTAWQDLKRGSSPIVAKIIDGKRIAVRPVPKAPAEDLTQILQQSLDEIRAKSASAAND